MLRTWLLTIHVATAMVYVGGHVIETWLFFRPDALGGKKALFKTIRAGEPAINVAAPLMIITGVWMVISDSSWSFTTPFVAIGVGGIIVSAVVGLGYALPEMTNLEGLVEERTDNDAVVVQRFRRLTLAWVGLAVLYLFMTWAMVAKP